MLFVHHSGGMYRFQYNQNSILFFCMAYARRCHISKTYNTSNLKKQSSIFSDTLNYFYLFFPNKELHTVRTAPAKRARSERLKVISESFLFFVFRDR